MKYNLAILASGSGTNAENIVLYFKNNPSFNISIIISNKANAFVIERAKRLDIDNKIIIKEEWNDEKSVLDLFDTHHIDYIILAGYLLKIPTYLLNKYPNRIINIHPALLPKFGGKGMYGDAVHKAVVQAQEKETGITIHFCNEHYDEGNIIFQEKCEVLPTDTYEDVANKVHKLEYKYYPKVIEELLINSNIVS